MKPKVITLCGSSRFPEAFALANMHLSMQGHIVIGLGCYGHADVPVGARFLTSDGDESTPEKQHLDQLHFRKIDISDAVFVVNPGGYLGSSTKREIAYALRQGKAVQWMFPAQGTEARQGRDACGSVHDGPVANGDAPSDNPLTETKEGSEHVRWPTGCIKPSSCARHKQCMYAQSPQQCRHLGKNLSAEIEEASHAR